MNKLTTVLSVVVAGAFCVSPAFGILTFRKEFEAYYKVKAPTTDTEVAFAELAKEARCNICHVDGEEKEIRNPYGMALSELLDEEKFDRTRCKEDPEGVTKEITDAFKQVEAKESPWAKTFGELIRAGKLPGAEPAE